MITVKCSEIWGGIDSVDNDVCSRGVSASLYSKAFDGSQGGDIYYFTVCGKDLITRIAIADVVGHGASVSEVSGWLYRALSDQMNKMEGQGVLKEMNEVALEAGIKGMTTASVFTINKHTSTFSFSSSGHPPFLYKKANTTQWEPVSLKSPTPKGNLPLGTLITVHYDEESFAVEAGDRFFFYTDGLTEASNERGEEYGMVKLRDLLNENADRELSELKQIVMASMNEHVESSSVQDDLTFMVMEIACG